MPTLGPKTWNVGDVLTAADLNQFGENIKGAYKTVTESVTSSTTLQADDVLTCAVIANAVYTVEMLLIYDADTAGDLKFQFTGPSGAGLQASVNFLGSGAATSSDDQFQQMNIAAVFTCGGLGAGTRAVVLVKGLLTISTTAGNFALTWAQGTSSGTATNIFASSYLLLRQVA